MLLSIGVDIGARNGAIAVVDENFKILYLGKAPFMEIEASHTSANRNKPKLNKETGKYEITYKKRAWTDYTQFRELFKPYLKDKIIYTMERVSVRQGEGEISSFIFGNSLGCFQGLSAYLNPIEIYEPTPQTWKNELGVTSDKDTSIELAKEIFGVDLRNYLKRGKLDDIAEALLLAVYGFKQHFDNNSKKENRNGDKNKSKKRK